MGPINTCIFHCDQGNAMMTFKPCENIELTCISDVMDKQIEKISKGYFERVHELHVQNFFLLKSVYKKKHSVCKSQNCLTFKTFLNFPTKNLPIRFGDFGAKFQTF